MIRRVLVPLDGSPLAESVLPAAGALARDLLARVILFHGIEERAPDMVHGQPHLTDADRAEAYLERVARSPLFRDREVEYHVHRPRAGDVADSIVEHAREYGVDLVLLSTHGKGGLRTFLFGRIATRVLQRETIPILLVNPTTTGQAPPFVCRTILVPLDGTSGHEPALPIASMLSRTWAAILHLEIVVPTAGTLSGHKATTGRLMPLATRDLLDLEERGAEEYVQRLARALQAEGLATTSHVSRGEPAACLIAAANRVGADLLVVASHAKGALDAFWSGSLTPKLVENLSRPILLVRAQSEEDG